MRNFEFDQIYYTQCQSVFSSYPHCEKVLYDLANGSLDNQDCSLTPQEIESLSPAISLNLVTINTGTVLFTRKSDIFVYLFARNICKNRLLEIYKDHFAFWNEFAKVCRESTLNEKLKYLAPTILIILNKDFNKNIIKQILSLEKNDFWMAYRAITDALPFLNINPTSLVSLLAFIENLTQRDMTRGYIYGAIQKLSEVQPRVATALLSKLKESSDKGITSFIPSVLLGFSKSGAFQVAYEEAYHLIYGKDLRLIEEGILCLAQFDYHAVNSSFLTKTLKEYALLLQNKPNSHILSIITRGYGILLQFDKSVCTQLLSLAKMGNPDIHIELSFILFQNGNLKNEAWYKSILITLSSIAVQYKGVIDNISYCLHNYLQENPEFIFDFFTHWIQNRQYEKDEKMNIAKLFNWILHDIFNQHKWLIEKYITVWFNKDDFRFHLAAADIIQDFAFHDVSFILDKKQLDEASNDDIYFVISKIMGYVHWNTMLCSLVFSVLQRTPENENINQSVIKAFNHYISYNYPGVTKDFLQEKLQNGTELEIRTAKPLIRAIDRYSDELNKLPRLKEFYPPQKRALSYLNTKARKQSEFMSDRSDEESLLSEFIAKVTLKGGKTSFSKINGNFTERTSFSEINVSYELPRGEIFDPVGQQYLRFKWHSLRKIEVEDETNHS